MGRLAVCHAAPWMWCCPGPTAPCHAGSRCLESAVRSGYASPRLRPVRWVVLPWRVSRQDVGWDGMRQTAYRDTLTLVSLQCETQSWEVMYISLTWSGRGSRKQREKKLKEGLRKGEETWRKETGLSVQSGMWNSDVVWIKDHFSNKFSPDMLSSLSYIRVHELIEDGFVFFSTNSSVHVFLQPIVRRKRWDLTITTPAWTALSRPQSGAPALKPVAWGCPPGSPIRTVGVRWWSRPDCVWSDPVTTSRTRCCWHSSHQRYIWTTWTLYSLRRSFHMLWLN